MSYCRGLGVSRAVKGVNTEINAALIGQDAADQAAVDNLMLKLDGTPHKARLGGNAIIATSLAVAKAAAQSQQIPLYEYFGGGRELPVPLCLIMYGGPVYVGVPGTADFQEYGLYAFAAKSYKEGFLQSMVIYRKLAAVMAQKQGFGLPRLASMAGMLTARFDSDEEALATLTRLVAEEGWVPGRDMGLYLDIAATHLHKDGKYHLGSENRTLSREEWISRIVNLVESYPIITAIEDCLDEEDWEGWAALTRKLGDKVQVTGDDFLVTNPERLKRAIKEKCANALVIKPNQVGTLTETFETIRLAKAAGWNTVASIRSGEMFDPYTDHLIVGQNLGQGKMVECPAGGQQLDELIRIEEQLGDKAIYRGRGILEKYVR
jgi:enolase